MKDFLFDSNQPFSQHDWALIGVFSALIVLGVVELIILRGTKNPASKALYRRWQHVGFTIGILGAAWTGMRYLFVPYLGTRFAAMFVLSVGVVWSAFIIRYIATQYGLARKQWEDRARKEKYLK